MEYKVGDEVLVKAKIITGTRRCFGVDIEDNRFDVSEDNIIPVPDMTAEEAWDLARKIEAMRSDVLLEIFCMDSCYCILQDFTPQEAKAKIEAWEAEKEIKVGDVVDHNGEIGIVTNTDDEEGFYNVLYSNGSTSAHDCRNLKKTGRHIDITGLLEQIGGDE